MNERERYIATLRFEKPDRIPFQPGHPRESTLVAWRGQGLSAALTWQDHLWEVLELPPPEAMDRIYPEVNFRMLPEFEEKIIERRDSTVIVQDGRGNVCEISNEFEARHLREAMNLVSARQIKCPVESRVDFESMKGRYDPNHGVRFDPRFQQKCSAARQRDYLIGYAFPGPFWQLREWCGFEGLCTLFLDDPGFVRAMIDFWRKFVSELLGRIFSHVTPDFIHITEDMAYKEKTLLSPSLAREFLLPCWREWAERAHHASVSLVDMHSRGCVGEMIPLWIDAGVNVCDPVEVAGGNDIGVLRRQFGAKMAFRQGIDMRALVAGGQVLEDEMRRIEPVVRGRGYIPGADHAVPPEVSWANFIDYSRLLARMTGWLD